METSLFVGTYGPGVFVTANDGATWTEVNAGLADREINALAVKGGNLFAGGNGQVYISANGGVSWSSASTGLNGFVGTLAVSDSALFAGTSGYGIFRSTNNGGQWTPMNNGLPNKYISALFTLGSSVFTGVYGGGVYFCSVNDTTWRVTGGGLPTTAVSAFVASGIYLFAGTNGSGVYRSTNSGALWKPVNANLTNKSINSLAATGNTVIAGTNGGVFVSSNSGDSWRSANDGLWAIAINAVSIAGTALFAGSYGNSVFRRPLAEILTSVEQRTGEPRDFFLAQNFPNPFNPSTTIQYTVPAAGSGGWVLGSSWVKLSVYDVLGREVTVLVDEKKDPGAYSVSFDASGYATGMYVYRLQARPLGSTAGGASPAGSGAFVQARKLLYLK